MTIAKKGYKLLMSLWTDPVVFISAFGPLTIGVTLRLAHGEFVRLGGENSVVTIFSEPAAAGIVDFTISFYTALLAWVILLYRAFPQVVLPYLEKHKNNGGDHENSTVLFLFVITAVACLGAWIFFLGGGAARVVLETYVAQVTVLGELHLPLPTRLLAMRVATGLAGIWMFGIANGTGP